MAEPNGWLSNAGSLIVGRLVVAAVGWSGTIIVARSLDQERFGQFTFVFGLLGMMSIITDMGLGRVAIGGVLPDQHGRSGPDERERGRFAGSYILLRGVLGVLGYLLAVGFTIVADYPSTIVRATALGGLVIVLSTVSHAYELILQAHLRMHVVAVSAVVGRFGQLGLTIAIALAGGGLIWFIVPAIVAEVVIVAVKVPRALRLLGVTYSPRVDLWSAMLREAVPITIGNALATLYFRVDSIMLSKLDDFISVGIYGVAFKFVDVVHFLSLSVSAPLLTVLVRSWPNDTESFRLTVRRTVGFLVFLSGFLGVYFALFAEDTIVLLYGAEYGEGARATQLLIASEIIALPSLLALTVLTATGRLRAYPYVALAGLVLNVSLNFWVIPRWSYQGAAVTTVVTELMALVAMAFLVVRIENVRSIDLRFVWRVGPAVAAAVITGLLVGAVAPWLVAAAATSAVYVAVSQLFKVLAGNRFGDFIRMGS